MRQLIGLMILLSSFNGMAKDSCQQVVISAHPYYPPFHWRTGDSLTGASIEISSNIFRSLGVEVRVSYSGPWKRVLKSAKDGKIDFIPALKNTPERNKYLAFTPTPFHFNPVAVYMRKLDTRSIEHLNDLDGLFGSITLGDKHGRAIDDFINTQSSMQHIKSIGANFKMLTLSRTDYFITGYYTGLDYLRLSELKQNVRVAKVFEHTQVHNAFVKSSSCHALLMEFDKALALAVKQGEVTKAIEKYEAIWLRSTK